jgi:hypothetical protein
VATRLLSELLTIAGDAERSLPEAIAILDLHGRPYRQQLPPKAQVQSSIFIAGKGLDFFLVFRDP